MTINGFAGALIATNLTVVLQSFNRIHIIIPDIQTFADCNRYLHFDVIFSTRPKCVCRRRSAFDFAFVGIYMWTLAIVRVHLSVYSVPSIDSGSDMLLVC